MEGRISLPTLAFSPEIETAYQQRALERGIRIARTERFANVTVMFADLVGFTAFTAASDASTVVELLNRHFSEFDDLVDRVGSRK